RFVPRNEYLVLVADDGKLGGLVGEREEDLPLSTLREGHGRGGNLRNGRNRLGGDVVSEEQESEGELGTAPLGSLGAMDWMGDVDAHDLGGVRMDKWYGAGDVHRKLVERRGRMMTNTYMSGIHTAWTWERWSLSSCAMATCLDCPARRVRR